MKTNQSNINCCNKRIVNLDLLPKAILNQLEEKWQDKIHNLNVQSIWWSTSLYNGGFDMVDHTGMQNCTLKEDL